MTAEETRLRAEVDRLRACLREIADRCDRVRSVWWHDPRDVTEQVGRIGAVATAAVGPAAAAPDVGQ